MHPNPPFFSRTHSLLNHIHLSERRKQRRLNPSLPPRPPSSPRSPVNSATASLVVSP
ncbi:hypothetical protein HN873_000325, partial [Arachis hypogaea]